MVTVVSLPLTAFLLSWVLIEKVEPLEPAGTTTLRGTWAASGGSAANDTSKSKGATMSSVTVASTELPPTTLADPKARDESVGLSAALRPVHSKTMSHKSTTCLETRIATPLGSKLENNVHHSRRIDRLTLMRGWLKPDLLGCLYCLFVQSVPQTLQYANHMDLPAGAEQNLQPDLSVNLQPASLLGVFRIWLGKDLYRSAWRTVDEAGLGCFRTGAFRIES